MDGSSISSQTLNLMQTSTSFTTILVSNEEKRPEKRGGYAMKKRIIGLAALAVTLACGTASAQQINVKIGVLTDMSSLYADATGPGSVVAARMAAADFMKDHPNVKVEVISGDHQNKPDIGTQLANQWSAVEKIDMIIDVPKSCVAPA